MNSIYISLCCLALVSFSQSQQYVSTEAELTEQIWSHVYPIYLTAGATINITTPLPPSDRLQIIGDRSILDLGSKTSLGWVGKSWIFSNLALKNGKSSDFAFFGVQDGNRLELTNVNITKSNSKYTIYAVNGTVVCKDTRYTGHKGLFWAVDSEITFDNFDASINTVSEGTQAGFEFRANKTDAVINMIGDNTFKDYAMGCETASGADSDLSCILNGQNSSLTMRTTSRSGDLELLGFRATGDNSLIVSITLDTLVTRNEVQNSEFTRALIVTANQSPVNLNINHMNLFGPGVIQVSGRGILYNGETMVVSPPAGSISDNNAYMAFVETNPDAFNTSSVRITSWATLQLPLLLSNIVFECPQISFQGVVTGTTEVLTMDGKVTLKTDSLSFINCPFRTMIRALPSAVANINVKNNITAIGGVEVLERLIEVMSAQLYITASNFFTSHYRNEYGIISCRTNSILQINVQYTFRLNDCIETNLGVIVLGQTSQLLIAASNIMIDNNRASHAVVAVNDRQSTVELRATEQIVFLRNNNDGSGGAATVYGKLVLNSPNVLFQENESGRSGGAIYADDADVEFSSSLLDEQQQQRLFIGNKAIDGGALAFERVESGFLLPFAGSKFINNTAENSGCVMYSSDYSLAFPSGFTLSGNSLRSPYITTTGIEQFCSGSSTTCDGKPPTPGSVCGPYGRWDVPSHEVPSSFTLSSKVRFVGGEVALQSLTFDLNPPRWNENPWSGPRITSTHDVSVHNVSVQVSSSRRDTSSPMNFELFDVAGSGTGALVVGDATLIGLGCWTTSNFLRHTGPAPFGLQNTISIQFAKTIKCSLWWIILIAIVGSAILIGLAVVVFIKYRKSSHPEHTPLLDESF